MVENPFKKVADALTPTTTSTIPLNNPLSTVPHRAKTAKGRAKVKIAQRTPRKRKSSKAPSSRSRSRRRAATRKRSR